MIRLSIERLTTAPELAALAILHAAAHAAILALAAVHPELHCSPQLSDTTTTHAALSVIEHARALHGALTQYSRALLRDRHRDDLRTF